jgi:carboxypeptidase Taq
MNPYIQQLETLDSKLFALGYSEALIFWDAATLAPKNSVEGRAATLVALSEFYYNTLITEETKELLDNLESIKDELSEYDLGKYLVFKETYESLACMPVEEYAAFKGLQAKSEKAWEEAKEKNDFSIFEPFLQKVIDFQRKYIAYRNKEGHPYNTLLHDYERGLTVETADAFFSKLRETIVPLVKKIQDKNKTINSPFVGKFPVESQKSFSDAILEKMDFDTDAGLLAESVHPFTINMSRDDVRITTHFYEENILSSIYSTIHEGGHALYEQNIDPALGFSKAATGTTMGIHESQSRIFENNVARSQAFWNTYLPLLQENFPGQFDDVTAEDCYQGCNDVHPSLIRIEADELTYSLHIMVRYELEKLIMEGQLQAKDLPQAWNKKYEEYLGIRPETDSVGVLQDVHWSDGLFGYFPSYALGSAYAAQFESAMNKEFSFTAAIEEDNLVKIKEWLGEHIHKYGSTKTPAQIIKAATGEDFNPDYFVDYLVQKYTALYDL